MAATLAEFAMIHEGRQSLERMREKEAEARRRKRPECALS